MTDRDALRDAPTTPTGQAMAKRWFPKEWYGGEDATDRANFNADIVAIEREAAALAGSGPGGDYDAVTCPTCGLRTCIGRLQYEDCAGSGPEAGLRASFDEFADTFSRHKYGWRLADFDAEKRRIVTDEARAALAATPTASPTDPHSHDFPGGRINGCICDKPPAAASPTATGERQP